jgi:hypothetical protein
MSSTPTGTRTPVPWLRTKYPDAVSPIAKWLAASAFFRCIFRCITRRTGFRRSGTPIAAAPCRLIREPFNADNAAMAKASRR